MMNLVRWSPLSHVLNDWPFPSLWSDDEQRMTEWHPLVDVYDNEKAIVIKAELPGVEKKNICVDVSDRVLTLKGERSHETEVNKERYCHRETVWGRFLRSFRLPVDVDPDKIKADYKDGVLKIEIPKADKQEPKHITVH
jgi:HSP20 family protein